MATIVIVHGGWGGGWEWTPVARRLRERGHEVFTPTLTGLGEPAHLGDAGTGLSDHIDDVLAVLKWEGLKDVVLCGHSYGGMVVSGVADCAVERIRLLVHLDSLAPKDAQAVTDLVPSEFADALLAIAEERGDGLVPIPRDLLPAKEVLPDDERNAYIDRLVPQSTASLTEPVRLSGALDQLPSRLHPLHRLRRFADGPLRRTWQDRRMDHPQTRHRTRLASVRPRGYCSSHSWSCDFGRLVHKVTRTPRLRAPGRARHCSGRCPTTACSGRRCAPPLMLSVSRN